MPLRPAQAPVVSPEGYEARLVRRIRQGPGASAAAMALLEHCDPPSLTAAIALVADHDEVTEDVFNRMADAWETYRHIKHLGWD